MIISTKLVLVECALQVLIVSDDDFTLLFAEGTPFFGS